ncbi:MAG: chemotaxis protein CheR [Candidatus Competibacteraceae bacterium]|nr:MAG: chemotaxis protein CheR [Candidatus Competibacteraceae bacterium]
MIDLAPQGFEGNDLEPRLAKSLPTVRNTARETDSGKVVRYNRLDRESVPTPSSRRLTQSETMKPKPNDDAKPTKIAPPKQRSTAPSAADGSPPLPHIVALGASAGGLEALQQFFKNAPPDSGMAFVVIQHLSPDYKSMMVELLSKNTTMPVKRVENGMPVEPNQVYLIPPKTQMTLLHGKLLLGEIDHSKGLVLPIDIFFKSLAEDQGERAIGVVLSGTGSDGTRGIRAIKETGGMVMVQEENSAKFNGMPSNAIATGLADFVLPPERMPEALLKYIQHPYVQKAPDPSGAPSAEENQIELLLALLRKETGVDFSFYKPSTILRRIERRMGIAQMITVEDYVRHLSESPQAVKALYKDLLISVTRFFRDPEAFEILRRKVIPEIFAQASGDQPVRIWVAGCATGEEAYSIAILCAEQIEESKKNLDIKIFATDLDKEALDHAGRGAYPESIVVDLPDEKLRRYFIKEGNSYSVQRNIRQMVVFAAHNILSDPPFTKISLVTCRNLLIYLQPILQNRVMTSFSFALHPRGYLFLGSSETIGDLSDSFETLNSRHKVFRHRGDLRPALAESVDLAPLQERMSRRSADLSRPFRASRASSRDQTVDQITAKLLREHVPACLVVEESGRLVYTYGTPGDFLALPAGQATLNALEMLPRALALVLSSAIYKAHRDHKTLTYRNIHLRGRDRMRSIDMTVEPFRDENSDEKLYLVFLAEAPLVPAVVAESESLDLDAKASQRINDLERELQTNKENLQAAIEELETANEELQATNEELLAANEELQSTNEELQSVNEELYTVNAEYQNKINELADLNTDMNNLLSSTQIGKLFLDLDLRIRKFTQPITQEVDLLPHDIGRPVGDFAHPFMQAIQRDAIKVLKTQNVFDQLMKSANGRWYLLRLVPYQTQQGEIFGVIAALIEVTALKESQLTARKGELAAAVTLNTLAAGVCAINEQGRIILFNEAFDQRLGGKKLPLSGAHFATLLAEPGQTPADWHQIRKDLQSPGIITLWSSDGTRHSARIQTRVASETTIWVATLID